MKVKEYNRVYEIHYDASVTIDKDTIDEMVEKVSKGETFEKVYEDWFNSYDEYYDCFANNTVKNAIKKIVKKALTK